MGRRTKDGPSIMVDDGIFVPPSDSSDSDTNLAHAAAAMRRTSQSHPDETVERSTALHRASIGTSEPIYRSGRNAAASRFSAAPASTTRPELAHVHLKRLDYSNPAIEKHQSGRALAGREGRARPDQRKKETPTERHERLLQMATERKRKISDNPELRSTHTQGNDGDVEMADDDWFSNGELITAQRQQNDHQNSHRTGKSQQRLDREAEARRKQESRERALRKSQRGRGIPVFKSHHAPRRAIQQKLRKSVEKYVPPVDFGSSSETNDDDDNDEEVEWDVEEIRSHKELDGEIKFEVKWTGYDTDENTWEPEEYLKNASKILERYKENNMRRATAPVAPMMGR